MEVNYWAILLSFLINLMKRYSSKLCSLLISRLNSKESPEIIEYRAQLKALREEKNSINPMDHFARYALVDRKINKLLDKLKENKSLTQSERMKIMMYINVIFTIFTILFSLALIWSNYSKPIINFSNLMENSNLSDENMFFPLSKMLAFPNRAGNNSIGVTAWILIANRFTDIVCNKINSIKLLKD